MFVAYRKDRGYYARKGLKKSWTPNLNEARIYSRIYDVNNAGGRQEVTVYSVKLRRATRAELIPTKKKKS